MFLRDLLVIVVCCLALADGYTLIRRPKRSDEWLIKYTSGAGGDIVANQTVVIENKEVEFDLHGGIKAVFDFNQTLLTMRRTDEVGCMVAAFDDGSIPISLEQIQEELGQSDEFVMPAERVTLSVRKYSNQTWPELSSLSATLCQDPEVSELKSKPASSARSLSMSSRPSIRPKRSSSLHEIFAINVVVVVFL